MNGLHVAHLRGADDPIDFQVALRALGRPHAIGFVGQIKVGAAAIGLAVNGHGLDAQLAAGANNAKRNLATIGD
jgi:hypothetical protein